MVDVDDSAFDPRPVIYGGGGGGGGGSDGREVADEEGGGSMPTGGRVHSFYYGDPLFEALDSMTWKDWLIFLMFVFLV